MTGCSRHSTPAEACTACSRVANAREQVALAGDAEPHVEWSELSQRMPWRRPRAHVVARWPIALGLGLVAATVTAAVLLFRHPEPPPRKTVVAHHTAPIPAPIVPELRARATAVAGEVRIEAVAKWAALTVGAEVHAGAHLLTDAGRATLQWGDGTGAQVSDQTELAVDKLDVQRTLLELNRGEVTLRVAKRRPDQEFAVGTPGHLVEVRGTWFTVDRDAGRTTVSVCEGRVAIRARTGGPEIHLEKGQSASFRDGGVEALPARHTNCVEPWLLPWRELSVAAPVHIGGAPAELAFDGIAVGPVPAAVLASPGHHKLELARAGIKEIRAVSVPEGGTELKIEKLDLTARAKDVGTKVFAYQKDLERCWDRGIKRDPTLKGKTKLRLQVAADGHVRHAEIFESDLGDEDVEACITTAARTWTFPPGPAVTSETTLELQ